VADASDELRTIERERLAAFVAADIPALQRLHANDFQLVNPAGQELNRDDYINGVALGFIQYKSWEPESRIQVVIYGDAAILRYRSAVEVAVQGQAQPVQHFWQIEAYEKRRDGWQAVFSQSTRISL
jgi:ketosteroid isomerase-like protein